MDITNKPISELIPYQNNPRLNDGAVEAVAASIQEFGFRVPIIIKPDGEIICGHTRYKAAQLLQLGNVPCIIADDLTDEQIRAYRLIDNKTAELSTWDEELLLAELQAIESLDLNAFGFDINPMEFAQVDDDDFELPDLSEEPKAQIGQIYQLGRHRLMCGDSTSSEDVKLLMDGHDAVLLLTDPPYNVDYEGIAGKIKNDNMNDAAFQGFLEAAFVNANEVLHPGGVFYIWHADSKSNAFRLALEAINWEIRECLIWVKNHFTLGRQDYHWQHEPCLYGWKEGSAHYFIDDRTMTTVIDNAPDFESMDKAALIEYIKSIQTSVLREDKPLRSEEHPTMKPIPLFGRLIKNSARQGDNILDLFGGSGTTLIAAEQLKCNCFMMEYDPRFVDVIIERWEKLTDRKAILIQEK